MHVRVRACVCVCLSLSLCVYVYTQPIILRTRVDTRTGSIPESVFTLASRLSSKIHAISALRIQSFERLQAKGENGGNERKRILDRVAGNYFIALPAENDWVPHILLVRERYIQFRVSESDGKIDVLQQVYHRGLVSVEH